MKSYERGGFVGALLLISAFPMFFFKAYAIATLWGWFLVEAIDANPITTLHAAGLILIWNLFTLKLQDSAKDEEADKVSWLKILIGGWAAPFLALVFGWTVKHFM